jgi:hypothetical protein
MLASLGGHFVLHAKALPGNSYDGHTLAAVIDATEKITGFAIERSLIGHIMLTVTSAAATLLIQAGSMADRRRRALITLLAPSLEARWVIPPGEQKLALPTLFVAKLHVVAKERPSRTIFCTRV